MTKKRIYNKAEYGRGAARGAHHTTTIPTPLKQAKCNHLQEEQPAVAKGRLTSTPEADCMPH